MRLYEIYIVLRPDLNEEKLGRFTSEFTDGLAKGGFGITSSKTKLAEHLPYPIKHFSQGHTLDMEISGADEAVFPAELEQQLRHGENVLRYMLLAKSEKMLKKARPMPLFEPRPYRLERRPTSVMETAPVTEQKTESVPVNVEDVDKKLEELLK